MKVSELSGVELDRLVANVQGLSICWNMDELWVCKGWQGCPLYHYRPSTDWSQAGLLMAKYGINVAVHTSENGKPTSWKAGKEWPMDTQPFCIGETPLIAICRCVVASVVGDEW